jgi:hypothetical protein
MSHTIHTGDVLEVLRTFPSESFDGCLTDPPYGLTFLGAEWDKGVPSSTVWSEVLRVLKPGAHVLAFGGTRTFHRLTCAIEDGGFEIRDCLMWLYGSGFPKSMDISHAIDKSAGVLDQRGFYDKPTGGLHAGTGANVGTFTGRQALPNPVTEEAKKWNGYGTTLKPGWEPCILAMKDTISTFAENASTYGVAGLNIEGTRIGTDTVGWHGRPVGSNSWAAEGSTWHGKSGEPRPVEGRWPANVLLDESITAKWTRYFYCPKASKKERDAGLDDFELKPRPTMGSGIGGQPDQQVANNRNTHPCVKPIELNKYLATLILPPPRGEEPRRLLVPFSGSGSEMIGALLAGWEEVVGIEKEPQYVSIAEARIKHWLQTEQQLSLVPSTSQR